MNVVVRALAIALVSSACGALDAGGPLVCARQPVVPGAFAIADFEGVERDAAVSLREVTLIDFAGDARVRVEVSDLAPIEVGCAGSRCDVPALPPVPADDLRLKVSVRGARPSETWNFEIEVCVVGL